MTEDTLDFHDPFSFLKYYEPENSYEENEKIILELITNTFGYKNSLFLVHTWSIRLILIIINGIVRREIYTQFKCRKSWTKFSYQDLENVPAAQSLIKPDSFCVLELPFSFRRVFFDERVFVRVFEPDFFNFRFICNVKEERAKLRDFYFFFGKDTTNIYRWDNCQSFRMLDYFLTEKTYDI